ncbi:MAG: helix-turn-helix transcriptional regulator [Lachnospiraceae bacterium]|nr:helix-turn-helix transcriptional regulator [Lachnospiraceae bacterium]
MSYYECLNEYLIRLSCTSKELAECTGLSTSLISKYRNGSRTPKLDSDSFMKVITGLKTIASSKSISLDSDIIYRELAGELNPYQLNYEVCLHNFNRVIDILGINCSQLAKYMQIDVSFLYRVRSGNRKPFDITQFFDLFANYLIYNYEQDKGNVFHDLFEISSDVALSADGYHDRIIQYLNQNHDHSSSFMDDFFEKLDSFDISQYSMLFDSAQEQTLTDYYAHGLPKYQKKHYTGIEGCKQAELDFLKAVLASDSRAPVFLFNEVSMESEFTDKEFYTKWLFGLALLLKKGIEINIIHNIYRPTKEMLLGIRTWLPLYMSGAVHSYYFDSKLHGNIKYMHCTSGDRALVGEAMDGTSDMLYYYTCKTPELSYFQCKSEFLIKHARPLMDFYFEERDYKQYTIFLEHEHANTLPWIEKPEFKNIEFRIKDNDWVMISRIQEPKMHFVIYNEKMIHAIRIYLSYY